MTNFDLVIRLFLQLTVILIVCRIVGWIGARFLGQTQVVSEMIAGVVLGPSLFGVIAPQAQQWLFPTKATALIDGVATAIPHPSMSILYALSQVGLVLYMFLVGLDFDVALIRGRIRQAGAISIAGIATPLAGGALLALALRGRSDLFTPTLSRGGAMLYLGAAMSITAFPMLARILEERGITKTHLGTLALAAGSIDDAIAWCLLAIVLATFRNDPSIAVLTIGGGLAYAFFVLIAMRPRLQAFERSVQKHGGLTPRAFTALMSVVMLCAWATDALGIYAVFGAFIAGTAMPRGRFAHEVRDRLQLVTSSLLLPIFFVYSGLNTRIGLLNSVPLVVLLLVIVGVAVTGKFVACTLVARLNGESWRDSAAIGTLINARGLMELIILNIGLERGIITPTLFTIMTMMAILTTMAASPVFGWIMRGTPAAQPEAELAGSRSS